MTGVAVPLVLGRSKGSTNEADVLGYRLEEDIIFIVVSMGQSCFNQMAGVITGIDSQRRTELGTSTSDLQLMHVSQIGPQFARLDS